MSQDGQTTDNLGQGGVPDDGHRDAKGKGKATKSNFVDRLQDSGQMVLKSLTGTPSELGIIGANNKLTGECSGTNRLESMGSIYATKLSPQNTWHETYRQSKHQDANTLYDTFLDAPTQTLQQLYPGGELPILSIAAQEASDGAEAVELLDRLEDDPCNWEEEDGLSWGEADRWQASISPSENKCVEHLDFTPAFFSDHSTLSAESISYLGVSDLSEAHPTWTQYWGEVISSYTSYVWGDLPFPVSDCPIKDSQNTPLVPVPSGSSALSRLRQILAHVRGRL
ncbi:hypothetical protein VHEMI06010 [[Torrubiella] hemipterigena]|uniref:Uncharacterized protein n=1 Tax=[Torrubiella] hemipterigena TaxID=1531966 RepID=A0A0A1TK70_9HYPO|nr:hypothetical protein VHEMI06010 [[Torrubiella] hemipterigena]